MQHILAPSHTKKIFDSSDFKKLVTKATAKVKALQKKEKINALAVCGNSGIILGSVLSYRLKIPLLVVRKNGDNKCADSLKVNGILADECRYLIIDDLISSGDTVKLIASRIKEVAVMYRITNATPVGIMLYHEKARTIYTIDGKEIKVYTV